MPKKQEKKDIIAGIYQGHNDESEKKKARSFKEYLKSKDWERQLPGIIVFLGVSALVLGFWQFNYSIKSPFKLKSSPKEITLKANPAGSVSDLSLKDTDSDGLSDYDELNIFFTSPYLEDSDSDGIDDFKEIQQKSNPNCPGTQICGQEPRSPASTPTAQETTEGQSVLGSDFSGLLQQLGASEESQPATQGDEEATLDFLSNLSAEQLRELLIEAGVPQDMLSQISDQELLDLAREALAEVR